MACKNGYQRPATEAAAAATGDKAATLSYLTEDSGCEMGNETSRATVAANMLLFLQLAPT